MPRYIDADGVKKCAAHAQIYTKHLNDDGSVTYEMHVTDAVTVKDIENAPTVDAVEVVRCKDCKHRGMEGDCPMCHDECVDDDGWNEWFTIDNTTDKGFCYRGERWEEDA